jgi:outer membrane protein TolC
MRSGLGVVFLSSVLGFNAPTAAQEPPTAGNSASPDSADSQGTPLAQPAALAADMPPSDSADRLEPLPPVVGEPDPQSLTPLAPGRVDVIPIDLAAALAAVDGQHPAVGVARWRTQQAYAQLQAAQVLWLPTLQTGASYHRLDGNLQNSNGQILDVNRSSLQAGLGAGAVGAGQTISPGVVAQFHFTDAIYQPRIVERRAWARGHAADAALHDQLLAAGLAYQQLLGAEQRLAIISDYARRIDSLAQLTADFAAAGEGLQSDADRLATERRLRETELRRGEEAVVTAAARLAEAVSAPPGTLFTSAEPVVAPIELTPIGGAPVDLVSTGLANRPELKEAQCLVAEATERLRRERTAPLVPSVLLGMTYGGFGGGLGDTVDDFNDRAEFNALAVWQVRNLGFGEAAARREQEAVIQQARFEKVRIMDRVAREVVEAHGQAIARAARVEAAEHAISTAVTSYDLNLDRIRDGQGLPLEALQSAQALDAARQSYLDAVIDYNEAQLRLYRALGWAIQP